LQYKDECQKQSAEEKRKNREFTPYDRMAKRQTKQMKLDQVGIVDNSKPTAAAPISLFS